jgi:hypothetical protein
LSVSFLTCFQVISNLPSMDIIESALCSEGYENEY